MAYKPTNANGRAAAANSQPVVLSTEDKAAIDGISNKLIAAPSTEAKQDTIITALADMLTELRDDVFVTAIYWEDRSDTTAVFYREERVRSQDDGGITTIYTRLSDNTTVGSLPAGCVLVQSANDRSIEAFRYKAIASGTGYSIGDWLSNTLIYDVDGNGSIISSTWYNLSTDTTIDPPNGGDIKAENETVLAEILAKLPDSLTGAGNLKVSIEESAVSMGGGTQYPELDTTQPATGNAVLGRYLLVDPVLSDREKFMPRLNARAEQLIFNKPTKVSGTLTVAGGLNQTLVLDVEGMSIMTVQTTTAWTGSALTLQGSINGTTWITVAGANINTFFNVNSGSQSQTIVAGTLGIFRCPVAGFSKVRIINLAAVATGVVTIAMLATNATSNNVNIEGQNAAANSLPVTITGSGASNLMKAEDTVHVSGDMGVAMWGVRQDALLVPASATGDYSFFALTKFGSGIIKQEERHKRTYYADCIIVAAAAATDVLSISSNAGANIISLNKLIIQGSQTVAGNVDMYIYKRSTANTGAATVVTAAKSNEADVASTAVVKHYAANPSALGTQAGGTLRTIGCYLTTTGGDMKEYVIDFGEKGKPIQLRNAVQDSLVLNLGGVTVAGNRFYVHLEWTEE